MKNIIKIGLFLIALTLTICNFSLNIDQNKNGDTNLALVENLSFADNEVCSLSRGDEITGTSCTVLYVQEPNIYLFWFNGCEAFCDLGGSNCCYELI